MSKNDVPEKIEQSRAKLFYLDGFDLPLVQDCAAWMIFKVIPEKEIQKKYDMIFGECIGAWADESVFCNGHWQFENASPEMRSLHYVAGGHFYAIGEKLCVPSVPGKL